MISKVQIKYIRSLHQKKYREEEQKFLVEGEKVVLELLQSNFEIEHIFSTSEWLIPIGVAATIVSNDALSQISVLQTPNKVLAIVKMPKFIFDHSLAPYDLYLNNIKDPGNLGTMIRTAEWFGLKRIFISDESAEVFNPKTVQASMGSIFRMYLIRMNFKECTRSLQPKAVYAASLEGENLKDHKILMNSLLVIGSESHGIEKEILSDSSHLIKIPNYGRAESLNAGVACGILLNEYSKQLIHL